MLLKPAGAWRLLIDNLQVQHLIHVQKIDENIDEFTGQIKSIDTSQQIIELSGTNVPEKGDTITGSSSTASSTVEQCESATATVLTGAVGTSVADFQNASGLLSED